MVGVWILDSTRDDPITDNAITMCANCWGQIIADKNHQPYRVFTTAEVSYTIKRDAEGDIVRVREVLVTLGLAVNHNLLLEEASIDRAIKDILNAVTVVSAILEGVSIIQLFHKMLVLPHCLELIHYR